MFIDQTIDFPVLILKLFVVLVGFPEIEGEISVGLLRIAHQFGGNVAFSSSEEFGPLAVWPVGAFEGAALGGTDSKLPNNYEAGLCSDLILASGVYGHLSSQARSKDFNRRVR